MLLSAEAQRIWLLFISCITKP